jgi:uncharacterized membrane protein (Fun14 family)
VSIRSDLQTKLNNNSREIIITDADDLLAAWQFKRNNSTKRSKNMKMVPSEYRFSTPSNEKTPLMPCHVSIRRKAGLTYSKVELGSTMDCHGHGRMKKITINDLDPDSVAYLKHKAPYVSPVIDTATLALVLKDLGISGKAIPTVINGRQYIAFSGYPGLRSRFPGTIYSAKNTKIVNMAIGALGIKKMVRTGGIITIALTVPLTIAECILKDEATWYQLAGNIASDLLKVGISALIGAIAGIALVGAGTYVLVSVGVTILLSAFAGWALDSTDTKYQLTEKLIKVLGNMDKAVFNQGSSVTGGFWDTIVSDRLGSF